MQEYRIVGYGSLNAEQKEQAIEIFIEGFGHMMTFAKDKDVLKSLFKKGFHDSLFLCYIEVFSKNETAARLYEKLGFSVYKKEKISPMIFVGSGYPILMGRRYK